MTSSPPVSPISPAQPLKMPGPLSAGPSVARLGDAVLSSCITESSSTDIRLLFNESQSSPRAGTPPRAVTPSRTGLRWPARRGTTAGIALPAEEHSARIAAGIRAPLRVHKGTAPIRLRWPARRGTTAGISAD